MSHLKIPVTSADHTQGPASAKVTLVEYGDFQCPDAGYAYPIVKRLQKHFGDDLRFVYRNFPLTRIHEWAGAAAELAEFAAANDRFWEMHDALFENQSELDADSLSDLAGEEGLNAKAAKAAIEHHTYKDRIQKDVDGGKQCGVHGTPTFFINGHLHKGEYEYEDLLEAIKAV